MNPFPLLPAELPRLPLAVSGVEVLVALVFVIGGLIKHVMEKAKTPANRPSQRTPPLVPPRPPLVTVEEERARRLMEALGRPGQTVPPPLSPIPGTFSSPPPLPPNVVTRRPPSPPPLPSLPPPPRPAELVTNVTPGRQPRRARMAETDTAPPLPAIPRPAAALRGRLGGASRAELRRAILLREVLGPPRALSEAGGSSM